MRYLLLLILLASCGTEDPQTYSSKRFSSEHKMITSEESKIFDLRSAEARSHRNHGFRWPYIDDQHSSFNTYIAN